MNFHKQSQIEKKLQGTYLAGYFHIIECTIQDFSLSILPKNQGKEEKIRKKRQRSGRFFHFAPPDR